MDPKHYGTDQNDNQDIMGPGIEIDGQNGESAVRVRTQESPGDTMTGDVD